MHLSSYLLLGIFPLILLNFSESFIYRNISEILLTGQIENLSYFSPKGFWGGEEVGGKVEFELKREEDLRVTADLLIQKGQFLYDKWYFNWEETPLNIYINGSIENDTLILEEGEIKLGQDFQLVIQGRTDLEKKLYYLNKAFLNIEDIAKGYDLFFKQPLQTIYPVMNKIGMEGKLYLEAKEFCFPDMDGQIWASFEGDIFLPYLKLEELKFLLPLYYNNPEDKTGFIQIGRLLFQHEEIKNIHLPLLTKSNQIYLTEAIQLAIAGGVISINRLIGTIDPFSLKGDVSFKNISPQFLPFLLNLYSEKLHFELTPHVFDIEGRVIISLWDGEVIVENLEIEDIFSSYPKIKTDIALKNIDLAQASQQLLFGDISGKIKGYIKNLVISHGQPEAFELLIESVKQKGKRQMISLAAVNNISVLAQGSPVIVSWFFPKKFPYQKIGIKCSLKNDNFFIHGLIKRDNMEYLVKRRIFGIDVVNRSPGQKVAFKEMMDRVKKISRRE